MPTIAIRPGEGRRLICPADCRTFAGLPIPEGRDLPAEGAMVPRDIWAIRALGNGDAVLVGLDAVNAALAHPAEPPQAPPAEPSPPSPVEEIAP